MAITDTGREIHRCLRAGHGFANTNSPVQHFGIGDDELVVRIEITWPSGIFQVVNSPTMYQISDVVEPGGMCVWDLDGDSVVGTPDLLMLLGAWGDNPGHPADFDHNGGVGTPDLLAMLGAWGPCGE